MKTSTLVLLIGLFAAGCGGGHQRPGTCPHRKAAQKAEDAQPEEKTVLQDKGSVKSGEVQDDADVSGYGNDPGEETQE